MKLGWSLDRIVYFMMAACLLALCRDAPKRVPRYYDFGQDYSLRLLRVSFQNGGRQESLPVYPRFDVNGEQFKSDVLAGYVTSPGYGFWFQLINNSGSGIRILWPEALYVDERSSTHQMFWRRLSLPLDTTRITASATLEPGQTLRASTQPIYKTYEVQYNTVERGEFSEPLIPTTLKGMSRQQMKVYVDDLARRQVPVRIALPVEVNGVRYEYTFIFVLRDRWVDLPKE